MYATHQLYRHTDRTVYVSVPGGYVTLTDFLGAGGWSIDRDFLDPHLIYLGMFADTFLREFSAQLIAGALPVGGSE